MSDENTGNHKLAKQSAFSQSDNRKIERTFLHKTQKKGLKWIVCYVGSGRTPF